jgi:hypothetical protein
MTPLDFFLFGVACLGLAWFTYAALDLAEALHRRHLQRKAARRGS